MHYPLILEEFWLEFAKEQLGCATLMEKERAMEQEIQRLSDSFTKERDRLTADYFLDPLALCAYGLFFFPQTYIRAAFAFTEILFRGWRSSEQCSILDLGAGMGAASFAIANRLENPRITAVDRSEKCLKILRSISAHLNLKCETIVGDLRTWISSESGKYDLILASFSLSENNRPLHEWTEVLAKLLNHGGIALILEPSLRETSEAIEEWRNKIAAHTDLHIWAPCLHRDSCPLLNEGKFWCHEVRSWQPPESLLFLNRHLYRQIHVAKFSFLAFGNCAPDPSRNFAFRLISPISKQKKNYNFQGCGTDGKAHRFQVARDSLTEENRRKLHHFERGDLLQEDTRGIHILESGHAFVVQSMFSPHHEVTNE